jgi:RES domain-containing protein
LTPKGRVLDPQFFLQQKPLTLYRLARARYANLSGIGASLAPGRWNRSGEEAIYTSTEAGVPLLERLVHTSKDLIPSNLALMTIQLSGDWNVEDDRRLADRSGSGWIRLYKSLEEAEYEFPEAWGRMAPFAIAVPSVIVTAWNVVLYPEAPHFWDHVSLVGVEPFEFDPRLFPERTPAEAVEDIPPSK